MKIALVSPYDYAHPSGVNLHVSALAEDFTRVGHDVKILAPSSRPHETQQNGNITTLGRPIPIRASGSIVRRYTPCPPQTPKRTASKPESRI